MYKISKDPDGTFLRCHDCSHIERIDSFMEDQGNRRTQAARAMQIHSREKHGTRVRADPIDVTTALASATNPGNLRLVLTEVGDVSTEK
jgi:hypothetical protein